MNDKIINPIDNLKQTIQTILDSSGDKRGKISSKTREFDKQLTGLNNKQLIEISQYLTSLIESDDSNDILEKLLDNVLENISGLK